MSTVDWEVFVEPQGLGGSQVAACVQVPCHGAASKLSQLVVESLGGQCIPDRTVEAPAPSTSGVAVGSSFRRDSLCAGGVGDRADVSEAEVLLAA